MQKHSSPKGREVAFVIVLVTVVATTLVAGAAIKSGSLFSSETAAWVQAVGSIAALFGGFLVLNAQRQHERGDVLEAAARLCVSGMNLLDVHAHGAAAPKEKSDAPDPAEFYGFEHLRVAMEALPIEKLPPAIIPDFAEFLNFVAQAEQRLAHIEEHSRTAGRLASERGLAAYVDTRPERRKLEHLWRLSFDCFERLRDRFGAQGIDVPKMRMGA